MIWINDFGIWIRIHCSDCGNTCIPYCLVDTQWLIRMLTPHRGSDRAGIDAARDALDALPLYE